MEIIWSCLLGLVLGIGLFAGWDGLFEVRRFGSGILVTGSLGAVIGGLIAAGVV